jgi:hypothetical protein
MCQVAKNIKTHRIVKCTRVFNLKCIRYPNIQNIQWQQLFFKRVQQSLLFHCPLVGSFEPFKYNQIEHRF